MVRSSLQGLDSQSISLKPRWIAVQIVDGLGAHRAEEFARLDALQRRLARALVPLRPWGIATAIELSDAVAEELAQAGITGRFLVDRLDDGCIVLFAHPIVREQLARHDEQALRRVAVQARRR